MKHTKKLSILILLLICFLASPIAVSALPNPAYVPGEILIKYKPSFRAAATAYYKAQWGISTLQSFKAIGVSRVKLPKGMVTGKKLRLAGKGQPGAFGGPRGDLYIQAKVLNDSSFSLVGRDLYIDREIKLTDAIMGTQIQVPTIDEKQLNLKIPAGTQHQTKLRMKGYGLPEMKEGRRGDLYARILVKIPKRLNKKQKSLIRELSKAGL